MEAKGFKYKFIENKKNRKNKKKEQVTEEDILEDNGDFVVNIRKNKVSINKPRDATWLKGDIEEKRMKLITGENNGFMLDCKEKVFKVIKKEHLLELDIICYGLGSIIESNLSRWQLAFLLSIKQEFKVVNSIQYYDPLPLTEDEKTILNDYGFQILEKNEEGKRAVKEGTLFYMPHCPMLLYENVLSSNWKVNILKKVYIIGNDLTNYYLNHPQTKLKKVAPAILTLNQENILCCNLFRELKEEPNAFNDMSIMWLDIHENSKLATLEREIPVEGEVFDSELITEK